MGNCQAIDAASLVIQHPNGRVERYYWPLTVSEVMKVNQGHYVALVVTLGFTPSQQEKTVNTREDGVRFTRVKLLRPTETLVLGQAYRLITSEEVMKGLLEKKYAKMKKKELESTQRPTDQGHDIKDAGFETSPKSLDLEKMNKPVKRDRHRQKTTSLAKSRHWHPSLQSISETAS